MIKFVHAADLHLDSPLKNLERKEDAPIDRLRPATREAFVRLVDTCIDEDAAFLLIAGDLYDHDSPNMQIAVFLRGQLMRLRDRGVRVVIVKGNHDADNRITSGLALPDNTTILSDKRPETVLLDGGAPRVAIHGQSFRPGKVKENLAAAYPAPTPGFFNIGLLHTSLAGNSEHAEYAPCSQDDLTRRGYDYWALGHIHKTEVLSRHPYVVFPGNLQGRSVRETGPKGCYVVEIEDQRVVSAEHRALDVIRWQHAEVSVDGLAEEHELIERIRAALDEKWRACDGRPGAFRLTLRGRTPLHSSLLARPRRWRETVLDLLVEIGRGEIWLETLRVETEPLAERPVAAAGGVDLLEIVREMAADPTLTGPLFEEALGALRSKLPDELKELPALDGLRSPEAARALVERLVPILAERLAGRAED